MSVSVVLPCYRQACFLPDALESLRAQTRPPEQVIVVDDGSPDDVDGAIDGFPEVHLVRQENRGLGAARNRGLALASEPYVVFLDADDRLMPEALEVQARVLDEHPEAAFVWGFNVQVDTDRRPLPPGPTTFDGTPSYGRLLEGNFVGAPLGVLFRRSILDEAGGFDEDLRACEDVEVYLRLARTHPIVCSHALVGEYRVHDTNMSADRQLIYECMVEVLDLQEPLVAHDPALRESLRRGRRNLRRRFVAPQRIERVGGHMRSGRWFRAIAELPGLLLRHPGPLARRVASRIRPRD